MHHNHYFNMPISAQEAMDKVFTLELKGDEEAWYQKLCLYTDYHIDKYFDGKLIKLSFENLSIPDPNRRGTINLVMCRCGLLSPKK